MAAGGYDGSININTKVDSTGFNKGIKSMNSGISGITSSLKGLAAAVGLAFGVAAVVNFGKASVEASTSLTNAMTGLKSIMDGQGRSFSDAQKFINSYISDGLVPATNAVTAYKNLASRGYTDPQIQQTLLALKDSAAFGRQASYSLGEAVQTATEGLKNENSILVDNAGVTKNVAAMWKDYATSIGTTSDKLTKQQKIQAETAGIMQETRFQTGDAAKVAATYSGEVLKLGFNFNNLKIAIGNAIIPIAQAVLPGLNLIITALTRVANLFAQVTTALFGKQANQQQKVADTANNVASSSKSAAKAQDKLADSTKKAGKAADNTLASFDDLNVLQEDTSSTKSDTSTPETDATGAGAIAGNELGAGVTVSPAVQAAADTIKSILGTLSDYFQSTFGPSIQTALDYITPTIERFKNLFSQIWSDIQTLSQPFLNWLNGDFTTYLQTWIVTSGKIIGGLLDTFRMVFSDIWNIVVFPMLQNFISVGLPIITQFSTEILKTLGVLFDQVKTIFDKIWSEGVAPALSEIVKMWSDTWDAISVFWNTWGVPIFDGIRTAFQGTGDYIKLIWDTLIKPVWDSFMVVIDDLWTNHLKAFLANMLDFIGELVTDGLAIYNKFILPVVSYFVKQFGPPLVNLIQSILQTVGSAVGTIIDVVGGVITVFKGIIQFITGVFTGDWTKAWTGIRNVFKGIMDTFEAIFKTPINAIIDMLNGLIGGINAVISGFNSIHVDIPDWVPKYGGKSFGIDIGKVNSIPHLATGAVIPPRSEFAAILGDNRNGRNLEAPEGLIREIVSDELGKINFNPQVTVVAQGDNAGLVQWMKFSIEKETSRVGTKLVTGGGR